MPNELKPCRCAEVADILARWMANWSTAQTIEMLPRLREIAEQGCRAPAPTPPAPSDLDAEIPHQDDIRAAFKAERVGWENEYGCYTAAYREGYRACAAARDAEIARLKAEAGQVVAEGTVIKAGEFEYTVRRDPDSLQFFVNQRVRVVVVKGE